MSILMTRLAIVLGPLIEALKGKIDVGTLSFKDNLFKISYFAFQTFFLLALLVLLYKEIIHFRREIN